MIKKLLIVVASLSVPLTSGTAAQETARSGETEQWSPWMHKKGHFEFQVRTEQVTPTVMKIRSRIRPDVAAIQREPNYANEPYYMEYSQGIDQSSTGGRGDTTTASPRRLKFPPNAPVTCVYEENEVYAIIQPDNGGDRLYMDHLVSMLPILRVGGQELSGFELTVEFGNNVGPGAVTRFTGTSQSLFKPVC